MLRNWGIFQRLPTDELMQIKYAHVFEGGRSALYVTDDDEVYGVGTNGVYNLLGLSGLHRTSISIQSPILIDKLSSKNIKTIQVVEYFGVAVNETGQLYHWGRRMDKKRGILLPHQVKCGHFVVDVVCGNEFLVILTNRKKIYFRGSFQTNDSPIVDFVELNTNFDAISVACGLYHSAIVSTEGLAYTCGYDHRRNYRNWNPNDGLIPQILQLNEPCLQIVCGRRATLCLLVSGIVVACGENDNLGVLSDNSVMKVPIRIRIGEPVKELAATWHSNTYAASTISGLIYTWGHHTRWPVVVPGARILLDAFQNKETPSKLGRIARNMPPVELQYSVKSKLRPTMERSFSADSLNDFNYTTYKSNRNEGVNKRERTITSKSRANKSIPSGIGLLVSAGRFLASRPSDRTLSNCERRPVQIGDESTNSKIGETPGRLERSKSEETIDATTPPSKRKPRVLSAIFNMNNPFVPIFNSSNTVESTTSFNYLSNETPSAPQSPVEDVNQYPVRQLPVEHFKGLNPFLNPIQTPFDPMGSIEFKFPSEAAECFSKIGQNPSKMDDPFEDIKTEVYNLQGLVNKIAEIVSTL